MKDHAYFTGWHLRDSSYEDRVREVFESFLSDEQSTSTYVERVLSKRAVTQWDRLSKSRLSELYFKNGDSIIIKADQDIAALDKTDVDKFLGEWRQD